MLHPSVPILLPREPFFWPVWLWSLPEPAAPCEAARGCRDSQALGRADFGTLGHHMLRQEVKRRRDQGRLPEFYYLQKNTVTAPGASPPLWRSLSWARIKLEQELLSPESRGQEPEGQGFPGPLQTAGVGCAPAVPWHGAHSDQSPVLSPQRDKGVWDTPGRGAAIPQHKTAQLFLPLWSPGKCLLWPAVGSLALSIPLCALCHPFCRDRPPCQLHVDTIVPAVRRVLQEQRTRSEPHHGHQGVFGKGRGHRVLLSGTGTSWLP